MAEVKYQNSSNQSNINVILVQQACDWKKRKEEEMKMVRWGLQQNIDGAERIDGGNQI